MRQFLLLSLTLFLVGCTNPQEVQQFAQNAQIVNTSLIQLNKTAISNTVQLANSLAAINCPIINASVSLGTAVANNQSVASNVRAKLKAAGDAGVAASDICVAAGYSPITQVSIAGN